MRKKGDDNIEEKKAKKTLGTEKLKRLANLLHRGKQRCFRTKVIWFVCENFMCEPSQWTHWCQCNWIVNACSRMPLPAQGKKKLVSIYYEAVHLVRNVRSWFVILLYNKVAFNYTLHVNMSCSYIRFVCACIICFCNNITRMKKNRNKIERK